MGQTQPGGQSSKSSKDFASILGHGGASSGASFYNSEYESSVKHFLDAKKKEFEEKFKQKPTSAAGPSVKLDDFDLDRTIGTGSFGRVMIVYTKRDRSQRYAMKMLKKDNIVKMKQVSF
jgi:protein kinase A